MLKNSAIVLFFPAIPKIITYYSFNSNEISYIILVAGVMGIGYAKSLGL